MNTEEIVRALRNCGGGPEGMRITRDAADLIETLTTENIRLTKHARNLQLDYVDLLAERDALTAQLAASQARERAAETAIEEMTYIIQKAAYRRCDYCIYRTEPCPTRGLRAGCDFEYAGERGPQAGKGENDG